MIFFSLIKAKKWEY